VNHWSLVLGDGSASGSCEPAPVAGAANMAVDHALLDSVRDGAPPTLRLYRWSPACLSFGRNQRAVGVYDPDRIRAAGLDVVRRPTGGLAVLHDQELTYCVLAPAALLGGPRATYQRVNQALVAGLRRLGADAAIADAGGAPRPDADTAVPCFQAPAAGEVVAGGRKLVGSAQRCMDGVVLQHGSILMDGMQSRVADLVVTAAGRGALAGAGSVTLAELLAAPPSWQELAEAIAAGFAETLGTRLAPRTLTAAERARAGLHEASYANARWTWRR
jgi:lipoyl(octanoyl) transferase